MAVAEYKLHRINSQGHKRVPDFIIDGGNWPNPADHTMIGWIEDNSEYYIPDTIVTFTKQQFVDRSLAIHAASPMQKPDPDNEGEFIDMTTAEVTTEAEDWYLYFVTKHTPAP